MKNSEGYVWEKMVVAVECLCGDGTFMSRLENATCSALIRLEESDLDGALGEDLKFVLSLTSRNILSGKFQHEPDELERKKLVEKMLHVLLELTRKRPR